MKKRIYASKNYKNSTFFVCYIQDKTPIKKAINCFWKLKDKNQILI